MLLSVDTVYRLKRTMDVLRDLKILDINLMGRLTAVVVEFAVPYSL